MKFLFFSCLMLSLHLQIKTLTIATEPCCVVFTPNSILHQKELYWPLFIGERSRYSTCTGVTWFHENYLAVLNLFGKKINTYQFLPEHNQCIPLQEITHENGAELTHSENLVVSPDGTLLAVCSDVPNAGIKLYLVNTTTHLIEPKPCFMLITKQLVHNVRFSHDGKYLATVEEDSDQALCIYKVIKSNHHPAVALELLHRQKNPFKNFVSPKGVVFSQNNRFIIVAYAPKARRYASNTYHGFVASYHFNEEKGTIAQLAHFTCAGRPGFGYEDIALANNDQDLICSDQYNDAITFYSFNPNTGSLSSTFTCMSGMQTQLTFPHGIGLKKDNTFLAVANYGDDKVTIYKTIHN